MQKDLIDLFGKREGEHGHDEPSLDTDDAQALARAMPRFDARFAGLESFFGYFAVGPWPAPNSPGPEAG